MGSTTSTNFEQRAAKKREEDEFFSETDFTLREKYFDL